MNNIIETCRKTALAHPGRIVLPDSLDARAIKAALYLKENGLGHPILLGNPFAIRGISLANQIPLMGLSIIDPHLSPWLPIFAKRLAEHFPDEPETKWQAKVSDPLWFGASMLALGKADYCIGGNIAATANVLRAGLKVLGLAKGIKTLSSIFIMIPPTGNRVLGFADCGVVPQPTAAQLADIAISSADSFVRITGQTPRVAMLSFSTKGSAKHACVSTVQQATELVRQRQPTLLIDGELQFDAAFVPNVAQQKAPGSSVAGQANVFVFPSLEAGNIGYKIAQRLGGYTAIGPLIQGLTAPMHDLSRGCSWNDIVEMALVSSQFANQPFTLPAAAS